MLEPLLELYTIDGISDAIIQGGPREKVCHDEVEAGKPDRGRLPLHSDPAQAEGLVLASNAFKRLFDQVYRSFSEEMQEENLTDFAGVLITLKDILSSPKYAWVREKYSRQFRYLIVDEFQDTDSSAERDPGPTEKRGQPRHLCGRCQAVHFQVQRSRGRGHL